MHIQQLFIVLSMFHSLRCDSQLVSPRGLSKYVNMSEQYQHVHSTIVYRAEHVSFASMRFTITDVRAISTCSSNYFTTSHYTTLYVTTHYLVEQCFFLSSWLHVTSRFHDTIRFTVSRLNIIVCSQLGSTLLQLAGTQQTTTTYPFRSTSTHRRTTFHLHFSANRLHSMTHDTPPPLHHVPPPTIDARRSTSTSRHIPPLHGTAGSFASLRLLC